MKLSLLPPRLHGPVREKSAEGLTARKIVTWLQQAHKIDVTVGVVQRILAKDRAERGQMAVDIVRAELTYSITTDFARTEDIWHALGALEVEAAAIKPADEKSAPVLKVRVIKLRCDLLEAKSRLLAMRADIAGLKEIRREDAATFFARVVSTPVDDSED